MNAATGRFNKFFTPGVKKHENTFVKFRGYKTTLPFYRKKSMLCESY